MNLKSPLLHICMAQPEMKIDTGVFYWQLPLHRALLTTVAPGKVPNKTKYNFPLIYSVIAFGEFQYVLKHCKSAICFFKKWNAMSYDE